MNYRRWGKGDGEHAGGLSRRERRREEEGGGIGKAISTHLPCRPREPIAGIPGASLDWQRARLSRRRRFSFKAVSVKRPSELFSRGRRVANEPSRRVVHVRILAIEAAAPRRKGRTSKERKKKKKGGERRFARVSNYNKSPAPPRGDIAAIATSAGVSEFTIGYVGNSNVCLSVLHAGNFAYLLLRARL